MILRLARATGLAGVFAAVCLTSGSSLCAQHIADLTVRDKTEVFIQHMVKFMNVEPEKYQAMVLEYEIGAALSEITKLENGDLSNNFVVSALVELHDDFGKAKKHYDAGQDAEALEAFRPLARVPDPYIAANAKLLMAELHFRGGRFQDAIDLADGLIQKDRLRLPNDYRACELVALSFEKLKKPLLEMAQYYILVVDYNVTIPKKLQARAQKRLNLLSARVGKPMTKVADWMGDVERALDQEITGEPTQEQEGEILVSLDKLIELQEAIERKPGGG